MVISAIMFVNLQSWILTLHEQFTKKQTEEEQIINEKSNVMTKLCLEVDKMNEINEYLKKMEPTRDF